MFSDGVLKLVKSGVINGSMKTTEAGKIVSTFLIGTKVRALLTYQAYCTYCTRTNTLPTRPTVVQTRRTCTY